MSKFSCYKVIESLQHNFRFSSYSSLDAQILIYLFSLCNLENDRPIIENASYHPLPLDKLSKLDYWHHHKPEILKQGRVTYFDPNMLHDDNESEGGFSEEDETEAANNEMKPEMKPVPLFASCSGDRLTNDVPLSPWTITSTSSPTTLVMVRSNIWPGAFAFVKDR